MKKDPRPKAGIKPRSAALEAETHVPQISHHCGLFCLETIARLVYCDEETHVPQITHHCGLCCLEETIARLVYCDAFLQITAVAVRYF